MSPYAKTLIFWVAFVICGGSMYIFWDLCLNPELGQGVRGTWLLGSFLSCIISGGVCVLMVMPEEEDWGDLGVQGSPEFNTNEQLDWLARKVVKRSLEILEEEDTLVDMLHFEIQRWAHGEISKQVDRELGKVPDKLIW